MIGLQLKYDVVVKLITSATTTTTFSQADVDKLRVYQRQVPSSPIHRHCRTDSGCLLCRVRAAASRVPERLISPVPMWGDVIYLSAQC